MCVCVCVTVNLIVCGWMCASLLAAACLLRKYCLEFVALFLMIFPNCEVTTIQGLKLKDSVQQHSTSVDILPGNTVTQFRSLHFLFIYAERSSLIGQICQHDHSAPYQSSYPSFTGSYKTYTHLNELRGPVRYTVH